MSQSLREWEQAHEQKALLKALEEMDTVDEPEVSTSVALMERSYAGLTVELHHQNGESYILLQEGEGVPRAFTVPNEKAMDAFHHPYVYEPI